jgi:hypothetical protein
MVPWRLAVAQGAAPADFPGNLQRLSPHETDDVLDRLHGFGGKVSKIGIFTAAGRMLNGHDDDLVLGCIDGLGSRLN